MAWPPCAPRGGVVLDQTMFYVTGGVAFIDTEFGGEVGPAGAGAHDSQSAWVTG